MAITFLTNEDEKKLVKTINGVTPDESGNIEITIPDSGQNPTVATVEPAEDDIPKVYFTGVLPTSKGQGDLQLMMRYVSKTADFEYPVTLKVQGSSSVNYPKKNFTLKPYKDSTYESKKKLAFKNWPELNKFVLKAHWIDHSHVRNVGTAKIWGKIVKSRSDYDSLPEELRNSPNNGATDGFTVRVFANGVYQGLYEWIVPKDKLFGQDSDIATHSILNSELNNQPSCAFATTTPKIGGNWSEELQDSMSSDISNSFANLITFVAGSTDEEFVANAENYFDVQSVIDFNIFARIFCIVDNLCRNQIFFTYDGQKWYEGCWDVDAVLGLPPLPGGSFLAKTTEFQTGYVAYRDYGITNVLYERVENLFMERFKARYWALRDGVLSVNNILAVYETLMDAIKYYDGLLEEEYAVTTGDGKFTGIPYTSVNNIQQIRSFLVGRLAYMDEVITNFVDPIPATGITLSASNLVFNSGETQTLTATVEPTDTTDVVVWSSDNESVAIVKDGVVTPISNGSANITATAGNVSASCAVSVSGLNEVVYHAVTNTLENCTNSNTATSVAEGASYSATITANDGYTLDSVTVTHNGNSVSVTDGAFTIDSVIGDIVITAKAVVVEASTVLYELPAPVTFDGTATYVVDTGVAPYTVDQDVTIALDFVSAGGNGQYFCVYRFGENRLAQAGGWGLSVTATKSVKVCPEAAGAGGKLVIVRDSTANAFRVYGADVNGDAFETIGEVHTFENTGMSKTNQNVMLGINQGNTGYYFKGVINSFIIDKKAWSADDVAAFLAS